MASRCPGGPGIGSGSTKSACCAQIQPCNLEPIRRHVEILGVDRKENTCNKYMNKIHIRCPWSAQATCVHRDPGPTGNRLFLGRAGTVSLFGQPRLDRNPLQIGGPRSGSPVRRCSFLVGAGGTPTSMKSGRPKNHIVQTRETWVALRTRLRFGFVVEH